MSVYQFTPQHSFGVGLEPYVTWENGFSVEELEKIEAYGDSLALAPATISGQQTDQDISKIRVTKTAWIKLNQDTAWFYDRMAYIANRLNAQFYQFDLSGFVEDFQYTVYDGETGGHYAYHVDQGAMTPCPRKFSLVLLLTDPGQYEGGELHILNGSKKLTAPRTRGTIIAFPAYQLHRVKRVTKGIRKTIVIWASGPKFR